MSDTTELAAQLGAALGDGYEVQRALGEGGFAVVFLVRDLSLKRDLAVKVLSPDMISSRSVLERFRREAETVAQLSHPNIVPLHFIGQQGDLLYLAMQCVDGGSIGDRAKAEGQLPVQDVTRVISEVAAALAHAHKRGVIHRDIKPANVLVDAESGRCLVTDFGIARVEAAAQLTATGMMLGTPAYLSPEQVTGEQADHRVDIFALGVMAYELLAGRVPFDGATPMAAMMKRLAGPPEPLATIRADVPAQLDAVIARCLAADPAERFQSANDVIRALGGEAVTTGTRSTMSAPVARRPERRVAMLIGLAAVVVLALGAAFYAVERAPKKGAVEQAGSAAAIVAPFIAIGGGSYVMGSNRGPAIAKPQHVVMVKPFQIERTEVTVGAYAAYVADRRVPAPWEGTAPDSRLPVTRVTWAEADRYCGWKYPRGGRLPTEEEWEAAARGAEARDYPYGSELDDSRTNTASARRSAPAPVGSFRRGDTPEGLEDMSGNVWEWTSTPMHAYPGAPPLADSLSRYRVIRGGAFDTSDSLATTWMRGYLSKSARPADLPNTGFRCVTG
ncbi:MAG: hypothetical protein JWO05_935 [Gemmatimonadetes bacterium]|nr:hypothetical protein [Gemmatimonadota bacterium]